jgi:DNA polymerase I-like protein with 3'-5' exonuclease and polymerase domains
MLAIDTETTGIDFNHGAKPYIVTTCRDDGRVKYWEWFVDPETRQPIIPPGELDEVKELLDSVYASGELAILQNTKFDARALATILPGLELFNPVQSFSPGAKLPWYNIRDTLIAGHLLGSNLDHDLTSMASRYVRKNIKPLEDRLEEACKKARDYTRRRLKTWRIASDSLEEMPSATDKSWKLDTWLPRALVNYQWLESPAYQNCKKLWDKYGQDHKLPAWRTKWPGWKYHPPEVDSEDVHPWWTVAIEYANMDSQVTVLMWQVMWKLIQEKKLDKIYMVSLQRQRLAYRMESKGVTFSGTRLDQQECEYLEESERAGRICVNIAKGFKVERLVDETTGETVVEPYDLVLPKGAVNNSIRTFCFDVLKLEPIRGKKSKTSNPTLDKGALEYYLATLPDRSLQKRFIENLSAKRKRDTALAYISSYRRFAVPLFSQELVMDRVLQKMVEDWYVLHPSLNPTGTDTLRWSSQNPNEQNISKKEGFNLRYCFGPAPGREWWSLDAENIELRLPAYEAKEKEMIDLFERPNDPPYFGSNHLLVSHILHKEKFELCLSCTECKKEVHNKNSKAKQDECCKCKHSKPMIDGRVFKKRYGSDLYQWVKNGNFAVQYGAVEASGTADRAYHVKGGQRMIQARFKNIKKLNDSMIAFANKHGYVETIPDKTVDPERGYPLLCTRTRWDTVLPTVPLNYHIQGTAMWWMMKAMIRCQAFLDSINTDKRIDQAYIALQVHDELVFDFPAGTGAEPWKDNYDKIQMIRKLMEQGGNDIGIPTPVSCEYHANNWSEGTRVKLELAA